MFFQFKFLDYCHTGNLRKMPRVCACKVVLIVVASQVFSLNTFLYFTDSIAKAKVCFWTHNDNGPSHKLVRLLFLIKKKSTKSNILESPNSTFNDCISKYKRPSMVFMVRYKIPTVSILISL